MFKVLALAAAVTLMLVGHASAQDSELKQLSNCHPPSSATPGETSGRTSGKGPWDSQSVDRAPFCRLSAGRPPPPRRLYSAMACPLRRAAIVRRKRVVPKPERPTRRSRNSKGCQH